MPFNIEEELKKLPSRSGVYLMHDASDEIIYVGKAVSLKNRVRQYFQSSRNKGPKIEKMVPLIARFEYIVTDSELEALILECNLIKEYRPKYNTLLKDDKTYPYICITLEEDFPRILFARRIKKGKAKYFGRGCQRGDRAHKKAVPDKELQSEAARKHRKAAAVPLLSYTPVRRALPGIYQLGRI